MAKPHVYEVKARSEEIDLFLAELSAYLGLEGFVQRVHLHEPRQQSEILELARGEEILSVEVDHRSLQDCILRISSPTVDPASIVKGVLARLCAGLISGFVRPFAGDLDPGGLSDRFRREIDGLLSDRTG